MEGDTPTRQRDNLEHIQGPEEGEAPPKHQRALPMHKTWEREREWGTPPKKEGEGMAPPKQHSVLPAKGTQERRGGGTPLPGEEIRGGRRQRSHTGKRMQVRTDGNRKRRWRTTPIRG